MSTIKVLIAEDHTLTAKLLARMLSRSERIEVIDVVYNGIGVLKVVQQKAVDVILLDITMPYLDGLQTMNKILTDNPNIKILILSGHTEGWIIEKSLKLGASGYLTKQVDVDEIVDAIIKVHSGENYLDDTSLHSIVVKEIHM